MPDQYFEAQVTRLGTWTVNAPYDVILVAGCVQDQQNARVAGARLAADGIDYTGTTSILSDSAGNYLLAVKKGGQAVVAARSEGKTSNSLVVGPSSTDVSLASTCLVLTDVAHNVTFRLTWGEVPRDVDGHLWLPDGSHVFYFLKGDLNGHPWASIDVDDTTSFGPEIITIRKLMVGTYTYIVNNFSENIPPGLTGSPTRVELNISGDSTAFTPPPDEGAALWWTAFTFTVDARCNVSVTPINTWSVAKPEPAPNTPTAVYCTPL